jgi:hypothetical protein
VFFFTILLSSTIQTLARRHHLSLGYLKKTETKKENERERIEPENKQKIGKGNKTVVSSLSFLTIT